MTVTSKLHAQVERSKKEKREEKAASSGGAGRDPGRPVAMMFITIIAGD